jgi:EAL domain-containing protein (putative c-di-GMP-specific phosphodiesterase class I)
MSATHPIRPSSHLASLLERLGVGSSVHTGQSASTCIVASIVNLRQIEQAHGAALALTVRHVVYERARRVCEVDPGFATMCGDHILFLFDAPTQPLPLGAPVAERLAIRLEQILSALGDRSIGADGVVVFPVIAARAAPFHDGPFDIETVAATAMSHESDREWRERFMSDMNIAKSLYDALDEYRLSFQWEPVCAALNPSEVRYHEVLLCEDCDGVLMRVGGKIPTLERLGLARRLDQWVVESTIEALRLNPGIRLGCNVSAQSATLDAWWAFAVTTLGEEPEVASRLTIEITETAPITDIEAAREFVKALQSLGCRIGLDDVGSGYSGLKALMELGVDIAKIGASFVREAREDQVCAARLLHLMAFARTCASSVVVEGIECDADAEIARGCGATSLQGYLFTSASTFNSTSCEPPD